MTAVACTYDEFDALEGALSEALLASLDEEELTRLLVRRFRHFLAVGHTTGEALLRAGGYPAAQAIEIALQLDESPLTLH